jgi:hypothetical protein
MPERDLCFNELHYLATENFKPCQFLNANY